MPDYLLNVIEPSGPDVTVPDNIDEIVREVQAVDAEMHAQGVWVFAGGLFPPDSATVVDARNGEALVTDGPFAEGKEHVGGFSIVRADDLDGALEWARKLSRATTLKVEVRPFRSSPPTTA
jgi:hypothetical protein